MRDYLLTAAISFVTSLQNTSIADTHLAWPARYFLVTVESPTGEPLLTIDTNQFKMAVVQSEYDNTRRRWSLDRVSHSALGTISNIEIEKTEKKYYLQAADEYDVYCAEKH